MIAAECSESSHNWKRRIKPGRCCTAVELLWSVPLAADELTSATFLLSAIRSCREDGDESSSALRGTGRLVDDRPPASAPCAAASTSSS